MKWSQRWNNLQICPCWDSNTKHQSLSSSSLILRLYYDAWVYCLFFGGRERFVHFVFIPPQHTISLSYRDLMISFEEILKAHTKTEKTKEEFPITLGINAFRGFLNEFNKRKENRELPDIKYKKERKKREKVKDKEIFVVSHPSFLFISRYVMSLRSLFSFSGFCFPWPRIFCDWLLTLRVYRCG